jgi:hypothetical protein
MAVYLREGECEMDETTKFLERHHGHQLSGMPYVTADGWDARILECDECHDHINQVRAIPAEGTLIDPDPHLVKS